VPVRYFGVVSHGNGPGPAIDLEDVEAFASTAHDAADPAAAPARMERAREIRRILEREHPDPADDTTLAVALLRDVLATCDVHPTVLLERYGREVQEAVTLLSWRLRALDIEREPRVYWPGIRQGPKAVRRVAGAERLRTLRQATSQDGERRSPPEELVEETREALVPILRDAGETWLVERLESLLERHEG